MSPLEAAASPSGVPPEQGRPNDLRGETGSDEGKPDAGQTGDRAAVDLATVRATLASGQGPAFWKSLDAVAETPAFRRFLEREYPAAAYLAKGPDRRSFFKLMAASFAMAGLAACEDLGDHRAYEVPYVRQPERIAAGAPLIYASTALIDGFANGILVSTVDGRPIKIEGNPQHPWSLGGTDIFGQGSILSLYDPERSQTVRYLGRIADWAVFRNAMLGPAAQWRADKGKGLRILTGPLTSPSLAAQIQALLKAMPAAAWSMASALGGPLDDKAAREVFGSPVEPRWHFDAAEVVVSVDGDFLGPGPAQVGLARRWAEARSTSAEKAAAGRGPMLALHAVGSTPTLTSAKADYHLVAEPDDIADIVDRLAAASLGQAGERRGAGSDATTQWIARAGAALAAAKGKGLVVTGPHQPDAVRAAVYRLNAALGAVGTTVTFADPVLPQTGGLDDLVDAMRAGSVDTLLMFGINPVYEAPGGDDFAALLSKVRLKIHAGDYVDETALRSDWHLPLSHPLESWGDARAVDGTASLIQPTVRPFYDTRTIAEILSLLFDEEAEDSFGLVQAFWRGRLAGEAGGSASSAAARANPGDQPGGSDANTTPSPRPTQNAASATRPQPAPAPAQQAGAAGNDSAFDTAWRKALLDGVIAGTASTPKTVTVTTTPARESAGPPRDIRPDRLTVLFRPAPTIRSSGHAANGWLQELPQPLTKLVWDNVVAISPALAQRMKVAKGDIVRVEIDGGGIEGAAWVLPGQADHSVTLTLGYGRTLPDTIFDGIGYDANDLRSRDAMWSLPGASLTRTGRSRPLATTQDLNTMEGHHFVRVVAPGGKPQREDKDRRSLYGASTTPESAAAGDGEERAWGMVIDTDTCIGCNACVVSCQAENNIAVVGKEQVLLGRDMHWLRIDRYYSSAKADAGGRGAASNHQDLDDPDTHFQPVPCMHCELAPCEVGCPVEATLHDHEGLNLMVYNRCVGTRACSGYCPYKVRRFNYLDYTGGEAPSIQVRNNPDVTVRSRGVMEKCTYCVQRIAEARIASAKSGEPIADGAVQTACQSACPTRAITFGNLADARSDVAAKRVDPRNYDLLGELNVRPRTTYLAERAPAAAMREG